MQIDAVTLGLIAFAFIAIVIFSLVVVIRLWVKNKNKTYAWFLLQVALFFVGFIMFVGFIIINFDVSNSIDFDENSTVLSIIGGSLLLSLLVMLIGISKLGKAEEASSERVEYNARFMRVIGMLVFYSLLCPLLPYFIAWLSGKYLGFSENDPLVTAFISIASLGLLILWLKRSYIINLKDMFSKEKLSVILLLPMVLTILGAMIILGEVDNFVSTLIPINDFWMEQFSELLGESFAPWKGFLTVAVVAPVVEEILFRGLILRSFLKHYSAKKSIIISALLFGIIHMNPWQFVSASIIGIILGWWYVKTESILPTIFGHALNNATVFILGAIGSSMAEVSAVENAVQHQPIWLDLTGALLLAGGIYWLIKLFKTKQSSNEGTLVISEEINS